LGGLSELLKKETTRFSRHGGTLLIGVDDDGSFAGIEEDMQTLKHANRDGFERILMDLAKDGFGGQAMRSAKAIRKET
jgi:predicted HTH transcriptional regulator